MNKKLIFLGLIILISMSFVYAYTFNDVLSGRVSLVDVISGKAIKGITSTCKDSDGGLNYNVSGNVTSTDSCTNSTLLREYFCTSANEIDAINYGCSCSYGKCA